MTLTQLEVFVAIIETQSFTKAAQRVGLSQSAVSHALKNLESEWGVKLLERGRNGIVLMPVGNRLMGYAKDMLRLHQAIREEVAKEKGLVVGTVRIGSFPTASAAWLPNVFAAFQELYPAIDTILLEGGYQDIQSWLQGSMVDIGILPLPQDEFESLELLTDPYVGAFPSTHPLVEKGVCHAEDLHGADFIMPLSGSELLVGDWLRKNGVEPRIHFTLDYTTTILSMVKRGIGVSVVPSSSLIPPGVTALPIVPGLTRRIGICVRSFQNLSPAVKAMISVIQTVFAVDRKLIH